MEAKNCRSVLFEVRTCQRGATLFEFALLAPILIAAIALIADAGMILFQYSRLVAVSASATREVAIVTGRGISVSSNPSCSSVDSALSTNVNSFWTSHRVLTEGIDVPVVRRVSQSGGLPRLEIELTSRKQVNCAFCRFFRSPVTVSAKSNFMLENAATNCT